MTWIVYSLVFFAGFVDSIAGGGGLISLSSFFAIGLPPHLALGTNKVSAFPGTGLSAVFFIRKGHVRWDSAITAFLGAVIGSTAGAKLALYIDERTITICMLIIIPLVALFIIFRKNMGAVEKTLDTRRVLAYSLLVGFIIGMYDGFIGPGTGMFLILAFTAVLGFNLLTACGNTKIVNFASNTAAAATFIYSGDVDYGLAIPCALCAIAGNFLGTRLAIKNGVKIVRPMMLFVVTLLLVKVAWDLLHG